MVLSKFGQKCKMCTAQYIKFLKFIFWEGGSGDETFQKIAEIFAKSFAKILEKFHEVKLSTKPQHYAVN